MDAPARPQQHGRLPGLGITHDLVDILIEQASAN
jgi:hypothetical protein